MTATSQPKDEAWRPATAPPDRARGHGATDTSSRRERTRLSLQLHKPRTHGWSTQRARVGFDQRDERTRIQPRSHGQTMDNPQGRVVTGTESPTPCRASTMPVWLALSSHRGARLAVLSLHIYICAHIHINIIYIYEIRRADEQDFGLKLCKQQQRLPIPTTTKGSRSPEVR